MTEFTSFGNFQFNLPVLNTLVERGLETPLNDHFVNVWRMTKHLIFRQLRHAYEDRYIRFITEHIPEDISRLFAARMIFI